MTATHDVDLDRMLSAWFEADADVREPERLLHAVLDTTQRTRRRPAWLIPERWVPLQSTMRLTASPRKAMLYAALILTLGLVLAFALFFAGQHRLPAPVGPARNGGLLFDAGGQIYVQNPDGSGRVALTNGSTFDSNPVVSPDGTRVAFYSAANLPNPRASVVVIDADGSRPRTVATDVVPLSVVAWSPDGRQVAFTRAAPGSPNGEIDVVGADGANLRALVPIGVDPVWSPDGQSLAYAVLGDTDDGVYLVGVDGSGSRRLSRAAGSGFAFRSPSWTPDGRSIVFMAGADNAHDIIVARTDGSGEREVVVPANLLFPALSPDGTTIAYVVATQNGYGIATIALDGTHPTFVPVPSLANESIVWAPDGTRVFGYGVTSDAPLGIGDPPLGSTWSSNEVLVIDPTGAAPTVTIPAVGNLSTGSWQRLAP